MKKSILSVILSMLFSLTNYVFSQLPLKIEPIKKSNPVLIKKVEVSLPSGPSYHPPLVFGDLEFGNNGILTRMSGKLQVINNKVIMKIEMRFQEHKTDNDRLKYLKNLSIAEGGFERIIYSAPEGWEIINVDTSTNWNIMQLDDETHSGPLQIQDVVDFNVVTPWGVINCQGKHSGDDILSYTGIRRYIFTKKVTVTIRQEPLNMSYSEMKTIKQSLPNFSVAPNFLMDSIYYIYPSQPPWKISSIHKFDYLKEGGSYYPPLKNGDREFAKHGPKVSLHGTLVIENNKVIMKIGMSFLETKENWTKAEGVAERIIYTAPEGWRIIKLDCPDNIKTWNYSYVDTNFDEDIVNTPWGIILCIGDSSPGTVPVGSSVPEGNGANFEDVLLFTGITRSAFTYEVPIVIGKK